MRPDRYCSECGGQPGGCWDCKRTGLRKHQDSQKDWEYDEDDLERDDDFDDRSVYHYSGLCEAQGRKLP